MKIIRWASFLFMVLPLTACGGTGTGGDQTQTFTLTVTKTGTGSGTVTSSPSGIDCGADCTESYAGGTTITLTATPASGAAFAGWGGDADCSDGVVTIDANKSCTATFNPAFTLTITPAGTGSGSVGFTYNIGQDTAVGGGGPGSGISASIPSGVAVTVYGSADADSIFSSWSGDADCSDGVFTMDPTKAVSPPSRPLSIVALCFLIVRSNAGGITAPASSAMERRSIPPLL